MPVLRQDVHDTFWNQGGIRDPILAGMFGSAAPGNPIVAQMILGTSYELFQADRNKVLERYIQDCRHPFHPTRHNQIIGDSFCLYLLLVDSIREGTTFVDFK